ncbi:MAG: 3,4-dihydroxy-2-butanone-4-phosphate synthase [Saprospiraceae bacterium]|nr:3,4-dihydroxy-2-butanone-4-phosphate synthase [Saprospiraceae bacterium]MBK7736827.1 3,4-dihydroxy-2-butanone-4-phosphate synthase [Saprospiraceae bacterium]MBK7914578.1 3,4-dihydroxy-2-butanone-4-phosphate synthase [Saprospiraceae bacterium]
MIKFNTIEEAIQDFKNGKIIIVVDNEDRENEGDFICAAETITPEIVNFMATEGRGLICAPLDEKRADSLNLPLMVRNNTSLHETAFTVSVDLIGYGCSTGISAFDRALTIKALADVKFIDTDFARPGHIFPLRAKSGGVLQRTGHTEAVVDLAKLAGMTPAGALVEILNEDGSMARLPDLIVKAEKLQLKIISINDLVEYRLRSERLVSVEKVMERIIHGQTMKLIQYRQTNSGDVHVALVKGQSDPGKTALVRVQHADVFSELMDLFVDTENSSLSRSFKAISQAEFGVILLLTSKDQFWQPFIKLDPANTQDLHRNEQQQREIGIGAQILNDLGVRKMQIISNTPRKTVALQAYGLEITGYKSF